MKALVPPWGLEGLPAPGAESVVGPLTATGPRGPTGGLSRLGQRGPSILGLPGREAAVAALPC